MVGLPKIFVLSGYSMAENVLVLGCGGTGAYVTAHISRLISVLNKSGRKIRLFLADGDVVENKNLKRQHFISSDINKNKASVLAERYSAVFGMEIFVIPKDLEKVEDFNFFNKLPPNRSNLVIGCVDNNPSRKVVYDWFLGRGEKPKENNYSQHSKFWIDTGNEERAGQVICGHAPSSRGTYGSNKIKIKNNSKITSGEFSLPCVMECYKELNNVDGKFNSELSCAERSESVPQNMQTNVTAATLAVNYAQKIILGEPLNNHGVEFSIDNVFSTKLNIYENLSMVDTERKRYWEQIK